VSDVIVVDYGIGNVFSVCNALKRIGATPVLTRDPSAIRAADRVILPGVGAFSRAMENLRSLGLDAEIAAYVATGRPFLGVCIGMQVLMDGSTEFGDHTGLGLIPGKVEKIPATTSQGTTLRVPHISWSAVSSDAPLDTGSWQEAAFANAAHYYFVHSFMARPADSAHLLASAHYGGHQITAAVRRDNVTGVQFHPERSGPAGLQLLKYFVESDVS
tara:strand:- start:238 stop:885 length:648 start_codon:yes stop_codon:yes gene_type:complete